MELTLDSPYIDVGIKIIDNLINYLSRHISFDEKKQEILKSLVVWLVKSAEQDPKELNALLSESNQRSEELFKQKYKEKYEKLMKLKEQFERNDL